MKGFILLVIALILSVILFPVGFFYSIFSLRFRFSSYLKVIAVGIDQLGNVVCGELFNNTLIQNPSYRKVPYSFGHEDNTISEVLGINKERKTLTKLGIWVAMILNRIEKDHVEKAIER
tara:strand:+ start:928 stop:1284 length:357 start_codon:yes stop_codon:yes gene_type:complete